MYVTWLKEKKKKIVKLNYIFWRSSLAYIMSYNCYSIVGFRLLLFRLEDLRGNYKSLSHSCSLLSIYPYINSLTHVCLSIFPFIHLSMGAISVLFLLVWKQHLIATLSSCVKLWILSFLTHGIVAFYLFSLSGNQLYYQTFLLKLLCETS